MNKEFITSALGALLFFSVVSQAEAAGQYGCATQYGGDCPTQEIKLTKSVKNPKTGTFVPALQNTDNKFTPGQAVTFRIVVKNLGSDPISKITVKDIFPDFVSFTSGPGKFDNNTKTLTFDITSLDTNEEWEAIVKGKIAGENTLPADQGITCVVNHAETTLNGKLSTDDVPFCIEKQVLPGTTKGGLKVFPAPKSEKTPPTGPELLALAGLLPAALAGFALRKKALK